MFDWDSMKNKIILADNKDIMKDIPDKFFELAIVDPPYGIGADENHNNLSGKKGFNKQSGTYKKYHNTNWDENIPHKSYFTELQRISQNQIIWGGNYFHKIELEGVIIWNKGNSGKFKEGELAKTNINTFKIFKYSRADAYINDCDMKIHPTQKPIALYRWLLQNYAKPNDKIIDTHSGSGSLACACHLEKYDFLAIEKDEDYHKASCDRLEILRSQGTLF